MPIGISVLCRQIDPARTMLLFGSGSSIPSGGPSSKELSSILAKRFNIANADNLDLPTIAAVIELKHSRRSLIETITEHLDRLQPARGLLDLPNYDWAGVYTTNYDKLIERSYERQNKTLKVVSANFDFGHNDTGDLCLYKIHGTLDIDVSLGHKSRMVITTKDYDESTEFRELVYAKFTEQMYTNNAVIVGHSLADPDLNQIVDEAIRLKRQKGAPGKVTLFAFEADENLSLVYESRGLEVCFGGIDELFAALDEELSPQQRMPHSMGSPLDRVRSVYPSTIAVAAMKANQKPDLVRMFNGASASYADILSGLTFDRDFADRLESQMADTSGKKIAYVIGPAGSGKTTGVRKALAQLERRGIECWEHDNDFAFPTKRWKQIDGELRKLKRAGVLMIDDVHRHLHEVNQLVDVTGDAEECGLRLLLVSSKPNWNHRLKSPGIFSHGNGYELRALSGREINSLLDILETNTEIASLVEARFLGFSRNERRRRLVERCSADMFVCMKNIFASESFDDILLREYAELIQDYQAVYRHIAAMESAGVRVHRQLVIRTIGIQASLVSRYLEDLDGIVTEHTVSEREGVFTWSIRHNVIADIIAKYKFADEDERFTLLERIIDNLNPSYRIEIDSMDEICDYHRGLSWIYDKRRQNVLLRKMISLAPYQRVPRHRLITNLIDLGEFSSAQTEIRLFEREIRVDGPVQRYKVRLLLERARTTKGILTEDRAAIVLDAAKFAETGVLRFPDDKNLYRIYLEVGIAYLKHGGDDRVYASAIEKAKAAYERILDPELLQHIRRAERTFESAW